MSATVEDRLGLILTDLRPPAVEWLALDLCARSDREVRRIERYRAESALSPDKRLSSLNFAAVPAVPTAQVMALAAGHEWLSRGANVLLFGPPDVGKTHLSSGIGHALTDAGRCILFMRCRRAHATPAANVTQRPTPGRWAGQARSRRSARSELRSARSGPDQRVVRVDRRALRALRASPLTAQHTVLVLGRGVRQRTDDGGHGASTTTPSIRKLWRDITYETCGK